MKTVNLGSKYSHRVTLRLNDEQYQFIISISKVLGVSPSDYIRMAVNANMVATKENVDAIMDGNLQKGAVGTHEDVKAGSDDIV